MNLMMVKTMPAKKSATELDEQLTTPWNANHKEPKFFVEMRFNNAYKRTEESMNTVIEAIIFKSTAGAFTLLDLNSDTCLPEYREKLKEWDTVTYLPVWCILNDIPCERFRRVIMRAQVHAVKGELHTISLEPTYIRRKRLCSNKDSELRHCNTKFLGFNI